MELKQNGSNKAKVMEFLEQHFDLTKFQVKDFPLMPGGVILIDEHGDKLLFYHDFLHQKIMWEEIPFNLD